MANIPQQIEKLTFTDFSEAYLKLYRNGNAPTLERLAECYPQFAAEISARLPSMLMLESTIREESTYPNVDKNEPIGGCFLGDEIGRGAFAVVYRAYQPELDREVAVKAIPLKVDNRISGRFHIERKALAKLDHPNIVPVYGYTQSDQQAYMIMKLVEGYSFEQLLEDDCDNYGTIWLNNLRDDWYLFAKIALEIVSALEHAHSKGLIHRDIKPSNLMLDKTGKVWITDFGLVKAASYSHSVSSVGDAVGTPRFMSPEQLRGECDIRSDIYSLGLTLFEIATGSLARKFTPDVHNASGHDRIIDAKQKNPNIPESISLVIKRCSEFSPSQRYQTTSELKFVLERFLNGQEADRRKNVRQTEKHFNAIFRKKYMVSVASGFLLLLGLVVFNYSLSNRETVDKEEVNLIAHLVEDPEKNVRSYLRKVTIDSIEDASKELRLSDSETNELVSSIDGFLESLKDEENPNAFIEEAIANYRDSNLAMPTRIMGLNGIFEDSGLDLATRHRARELIRQFAIVVLNNQMTDSDAQSIIASLTNGRDLTMKATESLRYNNKQLTNWLSLLEHLLAGKNVGQVSLKLKEDLEKILGQREESAKSRNLGAPSNPIQSRSGQVLPPRKISKDQIDDVVKSVGGKTEAEKIFNGLPRELQDELKRRVKGAK